MPHQIYVLMRNFVDKGGAILFYSTEIPELVNMCDRVLVIYEGKFTTEFVGENVEEEAIMRAALGESADASNRAS